MEQDIGSQLCKHICVVAELWLSAAAQLLFAVAVEEELVCREPPGSSCGPGP